MGLDWMCIGAKLPAFAQSAVSSVHVCTEPSEGILRPACRRHNPEHQAELGRNTFRSALKIAHASAALIGRKRSRSKQEDIKIFRRAADARVEAWRRRCHKDRRDILKKIKL
jgi:predicted lipid-binding transport protein (Tim44 family)